MWPEMCMLPKSPGSLNHLYLKALRHVEGVFASGCISLSTRKASHRCRQACFQAFCSSVRLLSFLDCTGEAGCQCCSLLDHIRRLLSCSYPESVAHLYG